MLNFGYKFVGYTIVPCTCSNIDDVYIKCLPKMEVIMADQLQHLNGVKVHPTSMQDSQKTTS